MMLWKKGPLDPHTTFPKLGKDGPQFDDLQWLLDNHDAASKLTLKGRERVPLQPLISLVICAIGSSTGKGISGPTMTSENLH